jgi:isopentenyl-diphosphate Delta-isomerase
MNRADEELDVVDEHDLVIGSVAKGAKGTSITRNVAVFLFDKDRLLLARRAMHKREFPGLYDVSACGNVSAGESYEDAARREVREELGIECSLRPVTKILNEFRKGTATLRYFTTVFIGEYHGDVHGNDETNELVWMDVSEVAARIEKDPERFTPGLHKEFPLALKKRR